MDSKRRFVEGAVVCALLSLATLLNAAIPPLHVDGNKIKDPCGNTVVLRGVSMMDVGTQEFGWDGGGAINMVDRLTNKSDTQGSSPGWYTKVLRVPVAPAGFGAYPFNAANAAGLYALLRTVVDYCALKDVYVIIDWHYCANTYDHVATTNEFWTYMAPRFADDAHVMYELFNEPVNNGSWPSVKTDMQNWTNLVRTYAPNNLILIGGATWSQVIGPAASDPVIGSNIVMVSHIYPGHWLNNQSWHINQVTTCAAVFPVLMTEWGFQSGGWDENLIGSIANYGQPLSDFREQYQIGNTAWVASFSWGPVMFDGDWNLLVGPSALGGFTKDTLYTYRNSDLPGEPPQSPYGGTAWTIPGTIEAEDYDTGGQDVSYHDTTTGNSGGEYRSDDVDIQTCGEGGYNVTGIKTNEWLEYTVDIESIGVYQIRARVASAGAGGTFHVGCDGTNVTGPVSFPATGGAQTYTNVDVNVPLQAGQHVIRLVMDSNDWNINRLQFAWLGGGTGTILREWWTGITGTTVANLTSDVNYPNNPNGRELITKLEGTTSWADNYGTRIRGYLYPLATGSYRFWIASDDDSQLWLSTNADPNHAVKIAYVSGYTGSREWTKFTSQQSSLISLVAGQKYYIEVLHKEGTGGDNVAVAWEGPGITQQVINGAYLSPYLYNLKDYAIFAPQWRRTDCSRSNAWCSGADRDRDGSVGLDDLMSFAEWWLLETN